MDLDPEKIHDDLLQVELPSTVPELKNPTEEYVINLLSQFLNRFRIDWGTIIKPTTEQQNSISLASENAEIISLINLSEAMAAICSQIFLKDFYLTDITSPSPKRTRKLAKVLSNFVLYALSKMTIIEERLDEKKYKRQELQDWREQRMALKEIKNEKALENAKTLALKEQLETEIFGEKSLKTERQPKMAEVQARSKASEKEKLEIAQRHGNLTAKAMKTRQITEELNVNLVTSPERHQARLQEVIEQKKSQTEKREVMQEKIRKIKPEIERMESHLLFVRKEHAKFPEVTSAYNRLTEMKTVMLETQKKLSDIKSLIEQETTMEKQENVETSEAILKNTKNQCEQNLSIIRTELAELLSEKKSMELRFEDTRARQQEIFTQTDKIHASIQQAENEYKNFVSECQGLYNREIQQERKMKEDFDKVADKDSPD